MTSYAYRVDGGPVETIELAEGAGRAELISAVSARRQGAVGLAADHPAPDGWGSVLRPDEQTPDPDALLGEPLAWDASHGAFVEQYMRENPHIAAQSGARSALEQPSERLQADLDRTSAARGPARSGPGFDAHGRRAPHGQEQVHPTPEWDRQRPGEDHWSWTQRLAADQGPYTRVARAEAARYMRTFGLR